MARVSKNNTFLNPTSIINEQGADYLTLDAVAKKLVLVKVVYFIISKVKRDSFKSL